VRKKQSAFADHDERAQRRAVGIGHRGDGGHVRQRERVGRPDLQHGEDQNGGPEEEKLLFRGRRPRRDGNETLHEEKLQGVVLHEPRDTALRLLSGVYVRADEQ